EVYNSSGGKKKTFNVFPYNAIWSPDSSRILVREIGGRVCIINIKSEDIKEFEVPLPSGGPPSEFDGTAMAWAPDGNRFIIGLRGDRVENIKTGPSGKYYSYHVYLVGSGRSRYKKLF
ncbi:MAG: hypothetical protein J7M18_04495, partial [Candidatus Eremiobacteraeota bacterium]|nr:hypothetical protein [Candidatus Eremiobacteraeota bacterium]